MGNSKGEKLEVKMVSYSNMKDMATISFVSPKGEVKTVYIHRYTFKKLINGDLDREYGMKPTLDQDEMKNLLIAELKGKNIIEWFDMEANKLCMAEATGSAK